MSRKWLGLAFIPLAFLLFQIATTPSIQGWRFDIAYNRLVKRDYSLDLTTGAIKPVPAKIDSGESQSSLQSQVDSPQKTRLRINSLEELQSGIVPKNWIAQFYEGKSITRTRKFAFPAVPHEISNRFAIGTTETSLYSLDLLDPDSKLQTFPSKFDFEVDDALGPFPLTPTGENSFFRVNQLNEVVEVFKIDSAGLISLVSYWSFSTAPNGQSVGASENVIYSLDKRGIAIEKHSAVDGAFLGAVELEQKIDFANEDWYIAGAELDVVSRILLLRFDLRTGKLKPSPLAVQSHGGMVNGAQGLAWGKDPQRPVGSVVLWNWNEPSKIVSELNIKGRFNDVALANENELLVLGSRFGLSIDSYDLTSGKKIRSRYPLWWILPLSLTAFLYFIVWSFLWIRGTARISYWAGLNHAIIVVVPIVTLYIFKLHDSTAVRYGSPGWFPVGGRPEEIYWILVGSLQLGICWLVFGRTRWLWRSLPTIGLFCCLALSFRMWFRAYSLTDIWFTLGCTVSSASLVAATLDCMKALGWKMQKNDDTISVSTSSVTAFKLSDAFVLVTICAVLVVVLKPYFPPINPTRGLMLHWRNGVLTSAATFVAIALAFTSRTWLYACGAALMLVATGLVVGDRVSYFCSGTRLLSSVTVMIAYSSVLPFFLAFPYRVCGWRLSQLS